jgi:indole-3-glycerol phosphate synthase
MLYLPDARPKIVIPEVKTDSPPFPEAPAWQSQYSWDELFKMAVELEAGDMVSIHTNSRWVGSFDVLAKAVSLTDKPILAKGFHTEDKHICQALSIGASKVLVVYGEDRKKLPADNLLEQCVIEPTTLENLCTLPPEVVAVWNDRDLETGRRKDTTFDQAREIFAGKLIQASNIATLENIESEADGILFGQHLPELALRLQSLWGE